MKPNRIVQVLPCYVDRDAVGGHTKEIHALLSQHGFESSIYAELWQHSMPCERLESIFDIDGPETIIIHHYSTGSEIPRVLLKCKSFKITCYHNITPYQYFQDPSEWMIRSSCRAGYLQRDLVRMVTDDFWSDSAFNSLQLQSSGFQEAQVLPILRDYSHLKSCPEVEQLKDFIRGDGSKIMLFVGRIAPNKAFHDLIFTLKLYQQHIDGKIRLVTVGAENGQYAQQLRSLCGSLGLKVQSGISGGHCSADVLMLGSVDEAQLSTVYGSADAFICLSDHEGFCVPLVEAMSFGLPVIAHGSTVIPETLQEGGLLVNKDRVEDLIEGLEKIFNDSSYNSHLRQKALERAEDFSWPNLVKKFDACLATSLNRYRVWREEKVANIRIH